MHDSNLHDPKIHQYSEFILFHDSDVINLMAFDNVLNLFAVFISNADADALNISSLQPHIKRSFRIINGWP